MPIVPEGGFGPHPADLPPVLILPGRNGVFMMNERKQKTLPHYGRRFLILGLGIFVTIPMYVAIIGDVGVLLAATLNALRALRA